MEENIINNIKTLSIDMIDSAGAGHPGICLGAAPILYTLYAKHLNINLNDAKWINRDRFVMSAGHGSALLYATLFMAGYLTLDDLKQYRCLDSRTPGHPEYGTPGVEATTGPLGQGLAMAVGLAIGEKSLEHKYTLSVEGKIPLFNSDQSLFNYRIYALCGDGDLMEGIAYEAASLAGTLKLNNLIVLYDSNDVTLDGPLANSFTEDVRARFEALGWDTDLVKNGNSVNEIDKAINKAKTNHKPTLIEIKTVIGEGSKLAGDHLVHGKPLTKEDIASLKEKLNIPQEPFYVGDNLDRYFQNLISQRCQSSYDNWTKLYRNYMAKEGNDGSLDYLYGKSEPIDLVNHNFNFAPDMEEATRDTNKTILNYVDKLVPLLIGGSADLSSSTKTWLDNGGVLASPSYDGRNIYYGVREHAMGAISNGLALTKLTAFDSTFLVFSDYMKASIRLAALMKLPVIHFFSHDSITLGSDGPTHQPIEQLAMLRSIPNHYVFRPCDANELVGSYDEALNNETHPTTICLSKATVPLLKTSSAKETKKGAYVVKAEEHNLLGIIIATGPEVPLAIRLANQLYKEAQLDLRVVSMPCQELFLQQSKEYQATILPAYVRTAVIEFGSTYGWDRFTYDHSYIIGLDEFGASGSTRDIVTKYKLDFESIKERLKTLFK